MPLRWHDQVKAIAQSVQIDEYAAGTFNGTSVDCFLSQEVLWIVDVGDVEGAPAAVTVDVKVQDSDDGAAFADAKDERGSPVTVQLTAGNQIIELVDRLHAREKDDSGNANRPSKRYRRTVAMVSFTGGTTPNVALGAQALVLKGR